MDTGHAVYTNQVLRYDRGIATLVEGGGDFLRARVAIARTGVFPYLTAAGAIQMEAKLPEELFSEITLETVKGVPVTDGHPPVDDNDGLLNGENWQKYAKGSIGDTVTVRGDHIEAWETIFDGGLIEELKAGRKVEVSIGFKCDIKNESGIYGGSKYDAVQRNIRINHVAHVEGGRGGDTVRAYLDAAAGKDAAVMQEKIDFGGHTIMGEETKDKESSAVLAKLKELLAFLGVKADEGKEPERLNNDPDKEKKDDSGEKKDEDAEQEYEDEKKESKGDRALIADLRSKLKKARARADALQAVVDAGQASERAKAYAAKLDAAIDVRLKLIEIAKAVVPDFRHDGMSDREIKLAVIEHALPFESGVKVDSLDEVYVDARYDAAVSLAKAAGAGFIDGQRRPRLDEAAINQKREARLKLAEEAK